MSKARVALTPAATAAVWELSPVFGNSFCPASVARFGWTPVAVFTLAEAFWSVGRFETWEETSFSLTFGCASIWELADFTASPLGFVASGFLTSGVTGCFSVLGSSASVSGVWVSFSGSLTSGIPGCSSVLGSSASGWGFTVSSLGFSACGSLTSGVAGCSSVLGSSA